MAGALLFMHPTSKISQIKKISIVLLALGSSLIRPSAAQDDGATNLLDNCDSWTFGTPNGCEVFTSEMLLYREYRRFYIPIPAGANFSLIVTIDSKKGDVDAQLLAPNGTVLSSSSERIGSDVVAVSRSVLSKRPGNYILVLQTVAPAPGEARAEYGIRIDASPDVTRLVEEDKRVLAAIASQCCPKDDDNLPDACVTLQHATASNATDEDDMCLQPPNMCNSKGRLTKLVLSGGDRGNLVCSYFPSELGNLSALEVLDWTGNNQIGTLAEVAGVLDPLRDTLKRLYLGRNALTGPVGCELLSGTKMEILRLEQNVLSGRLPDCLFTSPTLKQLSLAGNLLTGTIPRVPPGCELVQLDLSDNGPPRGLYRSNPGFQGPLPAMDVAINLVNLNVQSNSLTGTIPTLPPQLQVLQAAYNNLTGSLPAALEAASNLRVLDLSHNQLSGTVSPSVTNSSLLTVLRLADNKLSGELPSSGWGKYLMDVDLSQNGFTGQELGDLMNTSPLIKLNLAVNNLAFDIRALANKVPMNNYLLYFNISHNNVYGDLNNVTAQLGRMMLFRKLLEQSPDDDEALQGSLPPQPLFDISYNQINSTFPLELLPLLDDLLWASLTDVIQLSVVLQPQTSSNYIACPNPSTELPAMAYLNELQLQYDLTCVTQDGKRINISDFQTAINAPKRLRSPKPPGRPPRPPSPMPPRPPIPGRQTPATTGSRSLPPVQGVSAPSGDFNGGLEGAGLGASPPPSSSAFGAGLEPNSGGGGGNSIAGPVAGGVIGGLVVLLVLAAAVLYFYRKNRDSRSGYVSKRTPLTFNSAYEAPSEGTASNYGDLQMFEFKPTDRPARHRNRMT